MIEKHIKITNDQYRSLSSLGGMVSEHIRLAIDLYIEKKQLEMKSRVVMTSLSEAQPNIK